MVIPGRRDAAALAAPVAVALVATALGAWRAMPGVGFWDTAEFQTVPPLLGTAHPTGYPTYVVLGWLGSILLAPLGEAAWRMNLLSAIFVGVAAGLTVDLVRLLTRSTVVGIAAGLGLAATPIVWAIGTRADPHALHLAFLAAILSLLVRWERARVGGDPRADRWLIGAAVATGLSAGNHSLTLLLGLPIALYVLAVEPAVLRRPRLVAACGMAFALPAILVYLELPLRAGPFRAPLVYGHPETLEGLVYVITGEQFRGGLADPFADLPGKLADLLARAVRELGPLAGLVAAGFAVCAARMPALALLTGSALAVTCFFNAAYVNADIDRYYLGPALIAWIWLAVLAATAVDAIAALGRPVGPATGGAAGRRLPDPWRAVALALAVTILLLPTLTALPARAAAVDRTADRTAGVWLDEVLEAFEPGAVVISWWSYSTSLWYAQHIEGRRTDIAVVDDRTRLDDNLGDVSDVIDANLGRRPVYVIRVDPLEVRLLAERYHLEPVFTTFPAGVQRVTGRSAADGRP